MPLPASGATVQGSGNSRRRTHVFLFVLPVVIVYMMIDLSGGSTSSSYDFEAPLPLALSPSARAETHGSPKKKTLLSSSTEDLPFEHAKQSWGAAGAEHDEEDHQSIDPSLDPTPGYVEGRSLNFSARGFLRILNPARAMDEESPIGVKCPGYKLPSSKSADGKSIHEHVSKYSRYVQQYCNRTGLLQMNVGIQTYGWMLNTVAKMARIKKGDVIFDWGSGCGTMLNYYHLKLNTTGVGIDITESAVKHAVAHAQPRQQFCYMDGSNLRMFPSESFDAIVSWATLYHIRRTLVQCDVVHQFIRMLKPGSIAYVGHLRTEKTQEYWKKGRCTHPNATIARYRDYKTFKQSSWRRHQFFSLIVAKKRADGADAVIAPEE